MLTLLDDGHCFSPVTQSQIPSSLALLGHKQGSLIWVASGYPKFNISPYRQRPANALLGDEIDDDIQWAELVPSEHFIFSLSQPLPGPGLASAHSVVRGGRPGLAAALGFGLLAVGSRGQNQGGDPLPLIQYSDLQFSPLSWKPLLVLRNGSLDDCTLQLSHNGSYLDLESTLEEQRDELDGFQEDGGAPVSIFTFRPFELGSQAVFLKTGDILAAGMLTAQACVAACRLVDDPYPSTDDPSRGMRDPGGTFSPRHRTP
ncbi:hypothetical protein P4O66_001388 [Electrophorus voltai]|uniref:FHOD1 N-terminal GTPase-binding domain-containing protein n=1 Tax=Electrophorus voltai TaxID=2609070 RepID=A0AAD9DVU5_9TELE|nr:hypothetical protein P4O66_001388 [Electrophorus voltai]